MFSIDDIRKVILPRRLKSDLLTRAKHAGWRREIDDIMTDMMTCYWLIIVLLLLLIIDDIVGKLYYDGIRVMTGDGGIDDVVVLVQWWPAGYWWRVVTVMMTTGSDDDAVIPYWWLWPVLTGRWWCWYWNGDRRTIDAKQLKKAKLTIDDRCWNWCGDGVKHDIDENHWRQWWYSDCGRMADDDDEGKQLLILMMKWRR